MKLQENVHIIVSSYMPHVSSLVRVTSSVSYSPNNWYYIVQNQRGLRTYHLYVTGYRLQKNVDSLQYKLYVDFYAHFLIFPWRSRHLWRKITVIFFSFFSRFSSVKHLSCLIWGGTPDGFILFDGLIVTIAFSSLYKAIFWRKGMAEKGCVGYFAIVSLIKSMW